jgi:hypothetical protein
MRAIVRGLANENGSLRGLTGQGEPGLYTLLGGTGEELGADELSLTGGSGQVSATSRLARVNDEPRLAAVASAGYIPPGGFIRPGGGTVRPPIIP